MRPEVAGVVAASPTTANAEAYQLYLKGRFYFNRRTLEDMRRSLQYFQDAVAMDPRFALAHVGAADVYNVSQSYGLYPSLESMPLGEAAARKALAIDPNLGGAHAALGNTKAWRYDWAGSEESYLKAIDLNPSDAGARYFYGLICLLPQKRYEESIAQFRKALELEPFSPIINANLASPLMMAGHLDEAEEQIRRTIDSFPHFAVAHLRLMEIHEARGRYEEAFKEWTAYDPNAVQFATEPVRGKEAFYRAMLHYGQDCDEKGLLCRRILVGAYAALGDINNALKDLERQQAEQSDTLAWFVRMPRFDSLRSEPRYIEVMKRMNLEP